MTTAAFVFQTEAAECGLAALAMVARHHGNKIDLRGMRELVGRRPQGMTAVEIVRAAAALKLSCRTLRVEPEDLSHMQTPAILHWNFDHYVVLEAVLDAGRGFLIGDPATGRRRVSLTELSAAFTGVAFDLEPDADFARVRARPRLGLFEIWRGRGGVRTALTRVLGLSVLIEAAGLAGPLFLQYVTDHALPRHDMKAISALAGSVALVLLAQALCSRLRQSVVERLRIELGARLSSQLFAHLLRLPLEFFGARHQGDIQSRFRSLDAIHAGLSGSAIIALFDAAVASALIVVMTVYDWRLASACVAFVALYCLVRWLYHAPTMLAHEATIVASARRDSFLLESVRGVEALKIYASLPSRSAQYADLSVEHALSQGEVSRLTVSYQFAAAVVLGLSLVVCTWLAAMLVLRGQLSVGMMLSFLFLRVAFTSKCVSAFDNVMQIKALSLHVERVSDVTSHPVASQVLAQEGSAQPGQCAHDGELRIESLHFAYPHARARVIDDFGVRIAYGSSVALVGPSGCGKSTLGRLIGGLLAPSSGRILVSGQPVAGETCAHRHGIVLVSQSDTLFTGTIGQNVALGVGEADIERVREACRGACVLDDILALPMGLDTPVGEAGLALSGGQRQRLFLARALYAQPRILILDEATSHLDVESERRVLDYLDGLSITRLHIAHRPQTIARCERVIELTPSRPATSLAEG